MFINLGLIGNPLTHSLSPSIHTHFLEKSRLNGGYTCFEVKSKEELEDIIDIFKRYSFTGINITVPYKCDIINFCDKIEYSAENIGAVNTILFKNKKIYGYNTDVFGFSKIFIDEHIDISDKKVLLLGAGGASRAAMQFFSENKPKELLIANRTIDKAMELKKIFNINATILNLDEVNDINCDIAVNSTSLGLNGEIFPYKANVKYAVIDMQYKPYNTPFLELYSDYGIKKINGFTMLIWQAYKSFNIWTDKEFYPDIKKLKDIAYNF